MKNYSKRTGSFKRRLGQVSLCFLGISVSSLPAISADYRVPPAPNTTIQTPPSIHDWSGFYVGAHGDYLFGKNTYSGFGTSFSFDPEGFAGGVLAGYNWQTPSNWVFGLEIDGTWMDADDTRSVGGISVNSEQSSLYTARARLGYAFDKTLVYGSAGVGFLDRSISASFGGITTSLDDTHTGFVGTVGAEFALSQNASLRAEYLYGNFDSHDFGGTGISVRPETHMVRAALVWNFKNPQ